MSVEMPKRIQRKRERGWRMPKGVVYVGRPSRWGNPFTVGEQYFAGEPYLEVYGHLMERFEWQGQLAGRVTAENCLLLFRAWCEKYMERGPGGEWIESLRGKDLACWCKVFDKNGNRVPCHGDILLSLANDLPMEEVCAPLTTTNSNESDVPNVRR